MNEMCKRCGLVIDRKSKIESVCHYCETCDRRWSCSDALSLVLAVVLAVVFCAVMSVVAAAAVPWTWAVNMMNPK